MRIACIGDSLTECKVLPEHKKWTYRLSAYDDIVCFNFGISGDTTTGMLGRMQRVITTANFTHCMMMGGANDLWYGAEINMILPNIFAMIRQVQYEKIIPIVGIPPLFVVPDPANDPYAAFPPLGGYEKGMARLKEYRMSLIRLCESETLPYVDFLTAFMKPDGSEEADEKLFLEDGLHFNEDGAALAAERIYQTLIQL